MHLVEGRGSNSQLFEIKLFVLSCESVGAQDLKTSERPAAPALPLPPHCELCVLSLLAPRLPLSCHSLTGHVEGRLHSVVRSARLLLSFSSDCDAAKGVSATHERVKSLQLLFTLLARSLLGQREERTRGAHKGHTRRAGCRRRSACRVEQGQQADRPTHERRAFRFKLDQATSNKQSIGIRSLISRVLNPTDSPETRRAPHSLGSGRSRTYGNRPGCHVRDPSSGTEAAPGKSRRDSSSRLKAGVERSTASPTGLGLKPSSCGPRAPAGAHHLLGLFCLANAAPRLSFRLPLQLLFPFPSLHLHSHRCHQRHASRRRQRSAASQHVVSDTQSEQRTTATTGRTATREVEGPNSR